MLSHRSIGPLSVSVVGLGCNNFGRRLDAGQTGAVVDAALEAGIDFFDTADVYSDGGSEEQLGEVLRGRRDAVVLATKFGWDDGGSAAVVRRSIDASLRRLGTGHIDLYQYHRPDGVTPIAETLGAMHELVTKGKVRAIGCSNFSAAQLTEAAEVAERDGLSAFVSVQNEYSLLERGVEAEVVPEARRLGMALIPFFPLASGLLTGKYSRSGGPAGARLSGRGTIASGETFDRLEALRSYAADRGIEPVHVAIGALAAQPAVASVIAGATKPDQVQTNAAAAEWSPTPDDLAELDRIFPPG